ncbi:MAG: hypothetical protein R3C30_03625 [Hyphomonadaceae bacterium]
MLGHILGWVVLLFQPRWVFMFAFTIAILALSSPVLFVATDRETLFVAVFAWLFNAAVFVVVAGPIVAVRKWLQSRSSKADRDVDAELARIRAEAAAREQGASPP